MSKKSIIKGNLTLEQIDNKIKETKGFWRIRRWMVIREAIIDPQPAHIIAIHFGLKTSTVQALISDYNRLGEEIVDGKGKNQRQHAYMTLDEEEKFLKPFIKLAEKGKITTMNIIKKAFEDKIGKEVNKSTISRLLARHGWKKKDAKTSSSRE